MSRLVVSFSCAFMSLALIAYSIWLSLKGTPDAGMTALTLALVLFLVSALTLKPGRTKL